MSASRGAERGFERYGDFFRALGGSVLTSVPARGPHADSANSAASRLIKNHSSNHDARYNDFAR
ncbi:MAG TPA: hypothetical protein VMQ17_26690 [Candidatus Sulfotelmatobacter sp.]|nr:hypothetical protein [Candidatus Sulfotelmatobacter sp.]